MKSINEVIQGPLSTLSRRIKDAVLETDKQSLIRAFEKIGFDSLSTDEQIEIARIMLKKSELFY